MPNSPQVQVIRPNGHKSYVPLPSKPRPLGKMPVLPAARGQRV